MPWNPAKLEQRIARAWRKHQTRPVSVINLVCSDIIEHRMLGLLSQKPKGLSAAGPARPEELSVPPASADPYEMLRDDLSARLSERLLLLEVSENGTGHKNMVAVVDGAPDQLAPIIHKSMRDSFGDNGGAPRLEILDRHTYETIGRLMKDRLRP